MNDTLITKYRPDTFDLILGQDTVVKSFRSALQKGTGRVFLFHGPPGTGKTSMARLGAAQAGSRPKDIREIDGAKNTSIDDMRAVIEGLDYKPFGNEIISNIIDEAQCISSLGLKSLLKSLEDVQPWVYWFLCTTELGKIPEAIKTRCLRYELKPVSHTMLFDLVHDVAKMEKLPIAKHQGLMELCAKEAGGSPRQALANLGACAEATTREEVVELLKTASDSPQAIDLARALLQGSTWGQIQTLLSGMKDQNPESIRQVVRAYCTTITLSSSKEAQVGKAMEVLSRFSQPFYSSDGISPVVLACGKLLLQ